MDWQADRQADWRQTDRQMRERQPRLTGWWITTELTEWQKEIQTAMYAENNKAES